MIKWLSIPLLLLIIVVFLSIFGGRTIEAQSKPSAIPTTQTIGHP